MGRRDLLALTAAAAAAALAPLPMAGLPAAATPLAPLGRAERVGGEKLVGLTPEQVCPTVSRPGRLRAPRSAGGAGALGPNPPTP